MSQESKTKNTYTFASCKSRFGSSKEQEDREKHCSNVNLCLSRVVFEIDVAVYQKKKETYSARIYN